MPRRRRTGPRGRQAVRIGPILVLIALIGAGWFGWGEFKRIEREHPEYFPWTPLALDQPIGRFTRHKLVKLGGDAQLCRALLSDVGDRDRPATARRSSEPACGFDDAIAIRPEGGSSATYLPVLVTACPVAAALRLWEREYLQRAAQRHFGQRVLRIDHFGSFSCRRQYNRPGARWSEHATGDAIDITAFRLADGRRVRLISGWSGGGANAAFLREVRDGACDLFATVLSPDYNLSHRDHFHLGLAQRGAIGGSVCR